MIELREPYRPRSVSFLEMWRSRGWRLKMYGIAYEDDSPSEPLLEAAQEAAGRRLPRPAVGQGRYGVGFLGVHQGRGSNFVFVDWWADENELHHHVYVSPEESPAELDYATPTGLAACVWDLFVIGFERETWIKTVLANPDGPDLEAYLRRRFEGRV